MGKYKDRILKECIFVLSENGFIGREISKKVKAPKSTIQDILKRMYVKGRVDRKKRLGTD